jgi:hypothetical protein
MKLLRWAFNLRTIYFKQTPLQIGYFYLLAIGVLWLVPAAVQQNLPTYTLVPLYIIVGYALLRTILRTVLVDSYLRQYPKSMLVIPPSEVADSSINIELNKVDQLEPIATYSNACVFTATFNFYRQTKYGDYLAKQAYYTVLEVPLKRQLPHILFDSRTAKNRQFKNMYLQAQKLSVQGSFDEIFDSYAPETYTIDTLSFVTPEVMEALIEASRYDVEIINDKVLLYAPLLDKDDLATFAAKGQKIADQLNDNIDTYRDDRLRGDERKTKVTAFSRSLLRSPINQLMLAGLFGLATTVLVGGAIMAPPENRQGILVNQISALIYYFFVVNAWKAGRILRTNKKALERYRTLYHTDRGKPVNQP